MDELWTQEWTFGSEDSCLLGCYTVLFGTYIQKTWIFSNSTIKTLDLQLLNFTEGRAFVGLASQDIIVARSQAAQLRNWCVTAGKGKDFSSLQCPDLPLCQPSLRYNGYRGSYSKGDWSGHEEVKNVWSNTTTPSPIQLNGLLGSSLCREATLMYMCWSSGFSFISHQSYRTQVRWWGKECVELYHHPLSCTT